MDIQAGKVQYYVYAIINKSEKLNLTQAVQDLGWEENEKELALRASFKLYNATYDKRRLSSILKIGQPFVIMANWGAGKKSIATVYCKKAVRDSTKSAEYFDVTAYDCLYNMQRSQDTVYFEKGASTHSIISSLFSKWGVPLERYDGPNVSHAKIVEKSKKIADIVFNVLDEAKKKGGGKAVIRASEYGSKVSVLRRGSNKDVFRFYSTNSIESRYEISIEHMVTRVKIVATEKDDDRPRVVGVVDGKTEYGILQRVINDAKSDDESDAERTAREIIKEDGSPERKRKIISPDVPQIRKGDKVYVEAGSLKGEYYVDSIQHNAATGKMTMQVSKKA